MGGRWFEELFGSPDAADREALRETALEELEDHLGISVEPVECLTSIHKVGHSWNDNAFACSSAQVNRTVYGCVLTPSPCRRPSLTTELGMHSGSVGRAALSVCCNVLVHLSRLPVYLVSGTAGQIHSYLSEHHLPVTLLGSSYAGVSVNDCITNALDQTSLLLLSY